MAAPTGNKFWKLRSKHGRDTLFATPSDLWDAACEYFMWCEKNPLIEIDFVGKDATEVRKPKMRAFLLQGLCLYCHCSTVYFSNFENTLEESKVADKEGFREVITRIKETIYTQKFTGAAAGFLNQNIIARDLGLTDKKEIGGVLGIQQITGMEIK